MTFEQLTFEQLKSTMLIFLKPAAECRRGTVEGLRGSRDLKRAVRRTSLAITFSWWCSNRLHNFHGSQRALKRIQSSDKQSVHNMHARAGAGRCYPSSVPHHSSIKSSANSGHHDEQICCRGPDALIDINARCFESSVTFDWLRAAHCSWLLGTEAL